MVGGSEKNETNAILNSKLNLELVEVGVELGNIAQYNSNIILIISTSGDLECGAGPDSCCCEKYNLLTCHSLVNNS